MIIIPITTKNTDLVQNAQAIQWLGTQESLEYIAWQFRPMSYVACKDTKGDRVFRLNRRWDKDSSTQLTSGEWIIKFDGDFDIVSRTSAQLIEHWNIDINVVFSIIRRDFLKMINDVRPSEYTAVAEEALSNLESKIKNSFLP